MLSEPTQKRTPEETQGQQQSAGRGRYRRILEASLSAVLSKGVVLLVSVITVPLTVHYLGAEMYGIWITISTTIALLVVLDLGIANTLTNLISEAYANDDREQAARYATTAFWMMILVAVVLAAVGLVLLPHITWGSLFHVHDPKVIRAISHAIVAAYLVFLVSLPAGLAAKMLGGYQEVRSANIFAAIGSILSLIAIFAVVTLRGSLPVLVLTYMGSLVGANVLCLLWLWLHHKPWLTPWPRYMDRSVVRRLMQTGGEFFLIQIAGLIVFNSDNLVITHYLGPAAVTPYSVAWRLANYAAALQMITTPALWPAYAEAAARGDMAWVRKTFQRVMIATMTLVFLSCIAVMFYGRTIIRHWAGQAAVPSQSLIVMMCLWVIISTFMNNTSCVLVALNKTRLQAWASVAAAGANIAATIWLVQRIGVVGVIVGTIASYLLILVIPQTWQASRVLQAVSK